MKDITPTGANLYEHEKVDESVALIYSEGMWLETLENGQWVYLEPTEEVNSFLPQEKYYLQERHYPSSHIELDWSDLYGELPDGSYRIAKEITNTDPAVLRHCTVYGEFTIGETASEGNPVSNDWGVSIKPDRVSRTGATALFVYSGSIPGEDGEELTYGDFLSLDRLVDGNWVPCDELAGYDYYVGDSSYPVVDGYGMLHEWPDRFGELADGHYRLGKQLTLTRSDGSSEERMVYSEFFIPETIQVGPIPLEELPENYSAEQAAIDGCLVCPEGNPRDNIETFQEFAEACMEGQPGWFRIVHWYYGEDPYYIAEDITFDGNNYTVKYVESNVGIVVTSPEYPYLKHFTGDKEEERFPYDAYEHYVLVKDNEITWQEIFDGKYQGKWRPIFQNYIYYPKKIQPPENPNEVTLEFNGQVLVTTTDFDRLEKIWILFEEAELLDYEPKTHSIGVGLNLILKSKSGETMTIELDPDSDLCRINGEYVFYGAYDEPDYIEKLWYYLGIPQWPDVVYENCQNALKP